MISKKLSKTGGSPVTKSLFEDDIRGKKARAQEMVLHSRGYQQSVVTIDYQRGARSATEHSKYISRTDKTEKEEVPVEYLNGEEHHVNFSQQNVKETLASWKRRYDKRSDSRDFATVVMSTPKGSDPENTRLAAIEFLKTAFPDNACMLSIHTDTNNPHVHAMVEMKNNEGKKLRINKRELFEYRKLFAQKCREHDIKVCASYRSERGVYHKSPKQFESHIDPEHYEIGIKRKKLINEKAKGFKQGKKIQREPWHKAMSENRKQQLEFINELVKYLRKKKSTKDAERLEKVKSEFGLPFPKIEVEAAHMAGVFDKTKQNKNDGSKKQATRKRTKTRNDYDFEL